MNESPIDVLTRGQIGHLVLQRPATLNALTLDMVQRLADGLRAHVANTDVEAILIRSTDPRAFCAGGDMKRIRTHVLAAEHHEIDAFFEAEYALNLAIAECPKPYVALIDGIAMGGGLGISVHGSHRLITERARLAMPETRIGLFPDVGGSHFLPRLPHHAGRWMALASIALRGHEAVVAGLGTHAIRHDDIDAIVQALEQGDESIDATLDARSTTPDEAFEAVLQRREPWFSHDTLAATLAALDAADDQDATSLAGAIRSGSPYSLKTALTLFEGSLERDLAVSLTREFAAVRETVRHPDFAEGVRALLVDKDYAPRWASVRDSDG